MYRVTKRDGTLRLMRRSKKSAIRDMNGKFQRILQDRIGNNIYSLTQRTSPLPFPPSKFVHPLLISNLK